MSGHWVYRCYGIDDALLYVGSSGDVPARLRVHSEKAWWVFVTDTFSDYYPSREQALAAETALIAAFRPMHNKVGNPDKLHLRSGRAPRGGNASCIPIGQRVPWTEMRDARLAKGMRMEDLGYLIGVGKSAISRYESGARLPSPSTAARLCLALGIQARAVAA